MQLSDLPVRGVTRLRGTSAPALASAAERRGPQDPVVVFPGLPQPLPSSPGAIIDDVLARAVAVAFEVFPAWLPDPAISPESGGILDRFAARELTHRHDGGAGIGTALGALATAALRPESGRGFAELPAADRRDALEYALTSSYHAPSVALAIDVERPLPPHLGDALSSASRWLARGNSTVWLFGPGAAPLDRFPVVDGPPVVVEPRREPSEFTVGLEPLPAFPPVAGKPHPASAAEQRLERGLLSQAWAGARHWNYAIDLAPLARPVRVDLLFPQPRLVVEVDGPDHRATEKYEADRRRDADLMLAGFRILRLTNARIMDDLAESLSIIRTLVTATESGRGRGA
ncbi:endonuclease domain-containing protein [Tsukamurella ocularis]|uniref:endonuclease domain-containing protein n=1 Tax=Tsukamurella ocularis TaxID=1970234 RepID=UPI0021684F84|nr:endonuclease domain-containing protein [Tsukamurella ocularis]MCS3778521.1 very-short-patch-repair endonuclease [Tsukamurella ocularis]MCS3789222.1 very-short-patch-repair endonuclease [Tsukamurella ocularis]MCS3853072.1 very-short-patch-repair endonuclease [Tsukamurella ocularis]